MNNFNASRFKVFAIYSSGKFSRSFFVLVTLSFSYLKLNVMQPSESINNFSYFHAYMP